MTVADARRFVASRGARRSGIAAPLWHIWLPAAPLIPDRVLGKSALFMIFRLEAVLESIVRRYFLQVPALLNSLVSGFTVRVANTVMGQVAGVDLQSEHGRV